MTERLVGKPEQRKPLKESDYLHVGDIVWWKGSYGDDDPELAEVKYLEKNCEVVTNDGIEVEKIEWRKARRFPLIKCQCGDELAAAIATLTNGHWAYGWQLWPFRIWSSTYDEEST